MGFFPQTVYLLSLLTSLCCTALLWRGYWRTGRALLMCSAICFVFFSLNNALLFVGAVVLPDLDLPLLRAAMSLAGVTVLLCGFIWEVW
jgi:Family of unknown function (DUF5985)